MVALNKNKKRGFTLVEMVVCIAIMGIVSGVLLGSRRGYSDQLDLRNQAYTLVLAVREAQVYSLGVKGTTSGGNPVFDRAYGIHVNASNLNQYISFIDNDGNGRYDSGTDTGTTVTLANGVLINRVCGAGGVCFTGPTTAFQRIDVTFKRPDLSAKILFLNNGGSPTPTPGANPPVTIDLRSTAGRTETVKLESSGQISIQ